MFSFFSILIVGFAVNGQVISPVEVNSSPSHVITIKGSAVWMHWNYTYVGDGPSGPVVTLTYKEQTVGFNSTLQPTIQTLAKRSGQSGYLTLESPVPMCGSREYFDYLTNGRGHQMTHAQ